MKKISKKEEAGMVVSKCQLQETRVKIIGRLLPTLEKICDEALCKKVLEAGQQPINVVILEQIDGVDEGQGIVQTLPLLEKKYAEAGWNVESQKLNGEWMLTFS